MTFNPACQAVGKLSGSSRGQTIDFGVDKVARKFRSFAEAGKANREYGGGGNRS